MSGPKIGLALGGGSARGLAHIPMLEVFDELGLRPSIICGCSIGALVGAGYASGMSARDIRERAERLLATRFEAMRYVFGHKRTRLRDILSLRGLGSLHIKGEKLAGLALPDDVPEMLEDTQIPFKVVATDFEARVEKVFDRGRLVTAVAASIAIPGVIAGPVIDGRVYVDGGVTNPVPFDHVREGTDLIVAIDVTGRPRPPVRAHHSNMEVAIGSLLIMFHQVAELRRAANPPDIYIEPNTDSIRGGDFFRLQEVFDGAKPAKEQLKRALDWRLNRIG
ncbi:MAG: patatin-like phospholipase family protein [Rhizobiales bacterium]|nr:patatin-like phospholipase family protein [Hyphomicrobiales bacterium]MBI3673503.1 patatin-like phospholipase family protein [Hyphomicrobiales bacterium]